jgi:hypothetical protein
MTLLGVFLIIITELTVTDMTPGHYGASPKDMPFFVGIAISSFSVILLVNTLTKKSMLQTHTIQLTEEGEIVRFGKYLLCLIAIPLAMPYLGFYTSTIAGLLALLLISGVRKVLIIIFSIAGVIAIIYLFLVKLSNTHLPTGYLI